MHVHILGICGTFMGGIAAIAREAGHRVTGCDANVYPPMSTQLQAMGIELIEGFGLEQLALKPDLYLVGNSITRGNLLFETILNQNLPYDCAPAWLKKEVLQKQHVLAVAGTHGKTTTTSMLTHILSQCGLQPGYLIGGVSNNFSSSASLGAGRYFVIEADEYDTALFDKRAKFMHYPARTAVLNNLEFDHADIYSDLAAIEKQFHHWLRTLPQNGHLVVNQHFESLHRVLAMGHYGQVHFFNAQTPEEIHLRDQLHAAPMETPLAFAGAHNISNALAAITAASTIGISKTAAINALHSFAGVKRRLEKIGEVKGVTVYDDFAHHPSAIATTIAGLKQLHPKARIAVALEPRSNTMKQGAQKALLAESLQGADLIYCYAGAVNWDVAEALSSLNTAKIRCFTYQSLSTMLGDMVKALQANDQVVLMSNGSFGGAHKQLLSLLN